MAANVLNQSLYLFFVFVSILLLMEYGREPAVYHRHGKRGRNVSILLLMEYGREHGGSGDFVFDDFVSILLLMEYGREPDSAGKMKGITRRFNPSSNGIWPRTSRPTYLTRILPRVSILLLMEYGRERTIAVLKGAKKAVSILLLMEYGRELSAVAVWSLWTKSFNPSSNGIWPRTLALGSGDATPLWVSILLLMEYGREPSLWPLPLRSFCCFNPSSNGIWPRTSASETCKASESGFQSFF